LLSQTALKSNPSPVTTTVSISLRAAAPVAGAEIDFASPAVVAKNYHLFIPVFRMPQEKIPYTLSLS
jgi:hypothetical protein